MLLCDSPRLQSPFHRFVHNPTAYILYQTYPCAFALWRMPPLVKSVLTDNTRSPTGQKCSPLCRGNIEQRIGAKRNVSGRAAGGWVLFSNNSDPSSSLSSSMHFGTIPGGRFQYSYLLFCFIDATCSRIFSDESPSRWYYHG